MELDRFGLTLPVNHTYPSILLTTDSAIILEFLAIQIFSGTQRNTSFKRQRETARATMHDIATQGLASAYCAKVW
jgi:hypothetical protein